MARRRELVLKEDRLELEARKRLTMALLRDRDTFLSTMEDIGRLDLVLAKAKLARRFCCCRPAITAEARVVAVDMIHPEVADHLKERGGEFTSVSLTLEQGATVITGANMGGKSVSMKSLTLNLLLAQTGFFAFAKAFSAPLFDSVSLICTDRQSVEQGRLNCVARLTTHYDGVSDAARRHYRVAGLGALDTAAIRKDEAPLDRLSRLMDYHLIESEPGEPCPRDALRVCRLLDLEPDLMEIFSKNS